MRGEAAARQEICNDSVVLVSALYHHPITINSSRSRCQISSVFLLLPLLYSIQEDRCWLLTVAGGVAVGARQAAWAGDALADAVAHVAGGGGPELVHHEGAAVPHGDVELPHAALPVLVDARSAGHDPLGDGGHGACKYKQSGNIRGSRVSGQATETGQSCAVSSVIVWSAFGNAHRSY